MTIIGGVILVSLIVAAIAALTPRRYKAEVSLTPVTSTKSTTALGGIAALAGATLSTGYQLTPSRMVELIKSRGVLGGVGMSTVPNRPNERVIDGVLGEKYTRNDAEEVANHLEKLIAVVTNKETGTITVIVEHKDSALSRLIASRVVDSSSALFVRTSKAQAQQQRIAQEGRVSQASANLTRAEEALRQFNFSNRVAASFSVASLERARLTRDISIAEQVYQQAIADQQAAYAHELEATPTVVVQDPLPEVLPKVRKRIIMKTVIAAVVAFVGLCGFVILADATRRRLARIDPESQRFRQATSTLLGTRRRLPSG
jgi:capsule polysaccharide export protein KpsE/RkpR